MHIYNHHMHINLKTESVHSLVAHSQKTNFFHAEGIPPDGTPIKTVTQLRTEVLAYVGVLIGISMTAFAVCALFNVIYRRRK